MLFRKTAKQIKVETHRPSLGLCQRVEIEARCADRIPRVAHGRDFLHRNLTLALTPAAENYFMPLLC